MKNIFNLILALFLFAILGLFVCMLGLAGVYKDWGIDQEMLQAFPIVFFVGLAVQVAWITIVCFQQNKE